jgi:hypothetical protein
VVSIALFANLAIAVGKYVQIFIEPSRLDKKTEDCMQRPSEAA